MWMTRKKPLELPQPGEALPGRDEPISTAEHHFLNGRPLKGPYAENHQKVLFGGPGETLAIVHNAHSRACFLPGILRAVREVIGITGLQVGLKL